MSAHPTLGTQRLLLRGFERADAPALHRLVNDRAIADTTVNIPHPYPEGAAEAWIESHEEQWRRRENLHFALVRRSDEGFVGTMSLHLAMQHTRAELSYWVGVPFWGQGYATEAAQAVVRFGFEGLGLHRITANYLERNPASGRVLAKLGMRREGLRRQHFLKWGQAEDVVVCGLLRDEFEAAQPPAS